jgi:hypothetical protein
MTTLKTLSIVTALLAGGATLAMAQSGPATGGYPPVAAGAGGKQVAPGPHLRVPTTASHPTTRHQRRLYMETNRTHKGSKLTPGY